MMVLTIRRASTRVRVEKPPSLAEAGRNTKRAIDEPASSIEDPLLAPSIKLPDLSQRIIRLVDPRGRNLSVDECPPDAKSSGL